MIVILIRMKKLKTLIFPLIHRTHVILKFFPKARKIVDKFFKGDFQIFKEMFISDIAPSLKRAFVMRVVVNIIALISRHAHA